MKKQTTKAKRLTEAKRKHLKTVKRRQLSEIKKSIKKFQRLNEALNKPLDEFGKDLEKRLKALGFETKVFGNQSSVPSSAVDQIMKNPKLAGMSYIKQDNGYEYIQVLVNSEKIEQLKKVKSHFQTAEGEYSPDKEVGWVIKNVKITNPGDIIGSDIKKYGPKALLSYYTSTSTGDKVKTRDIQKPQALK